MMAFDGCEDLRTIEGLGCEEMEDGCFAGCTSRAVDQGVGLPP
jgi:hypothetical protein